MSLLSPDAAGADDLARPTNKNAGACGAGVIVENVRSDGLQIGGGGFAAALIGLHVERELLAFVEIAHAGLLDRRDVHEHIRAAAVLHDEAEAFLRIEELNGTCGQSGLLLKTQTVRLCPMRTIRMGLISGLLRVLGGKARADRKHKVRLNRERALYGRLPP